MHAARVAACAGRSRIGLRGVRSCSPRFSPRPRRDDTNAILPRRRRPHGMKDLSSRAREELSRSPTERAVAENLFLSFGTVDDRGRITLRPHDLRRMLRSMGMVVSEDKLSEMVARADRGSDGYVAEDDFLEAFDWLMSQGQDERDYMAIFNMLDRDKNGHVDMDELTNLHSTTRERFTMAEAKKILQAADKDGDGRMNYAEFLDMMTNNMAHLEACTLVTCTRKQPLFLDKQGSDSLTKTMKVT